MNQQDDIEDTDIPSEQIIKLLLSDKQFSAVDSIWLRIEPRYGRGVDWSTLRNVMAKVREVVRPGANPSDRYNKMIDKLNEQLEVHSVVEVFGALKPGPHFGREVSRV